MEMSQIDRSFEKGVMKLTFDIWRSKLAFILISLITFVLIIIAIVGIQPIYEASTVLIVGQERFEQSPNSKSITPETNISLARIAESEEVIRDAIKKVGLDRIDEKTDENSVSTISRIRSFLFNAKIGAQKISPVDLAVPKVMLALSVKAEPLSNIIRIIFKDKDPIIAERFVNAIAQTFVDRQIALFSKPGAADFFSHQKQKFDDEFQTASKNLEKFEISTGTYLTEEQRILVLKRYNDIALATSVTRSSIAEKLGQKQALVTQIQKLSLSGSSNLQTFLEWVNKGDTDKNKDDLYFNRNQAKGLSPLEQKNSSPSLLLSKVYTETLVALSVVNSNLAGVENMQKQQERELISLKAELDRISTNEKEYTKLKQAVTQAAYNLDLCAKRMVEEQITADLNTAKLFSTVKIVQKATVPIKPIFPNYGLITVLAFGMSLVAGVTAIKVMAGFLEANGKIRPQLRAQVNTASAPVTSPLPGE